jgi:16S rRNA processing protein RimM
VGGITLPHGIKGVVKMRPETDDPGRLESIDTLYLGETEDGLRPCTVKSIGFQPFKAGLAVLLELEGVESREAAKAMAGQTVWAREQDLPPLEEGEVFLSDLIGLKVMAEGREVGEVVDVLELPACPTLSIRRLDGSLGMVPFVPDLVPDVDLEAGYLTVVPLEGLLEGEATSERD